MNFLEEMSLSIKKLDISRSMINTKAASLYLLKSAMTECKLKELLNNSFNFIQQ